MFAKLTTQGLQPDQGNRMCWTADRESIEDLCMRVIS